MIPSDWKPGKELLDPYSRRQELPQQPRDRNGRPIRVCRWCGGEVAGRRRTWCSQECVLDYRIRNADSAVVRQELWKRDRGVCAECGFNCKWIQRWLDRMGRRVKKAYWGHMRASRPRAARQKDRERLETAVRELRRRGFNVWLGFGSSLRGHHLWEADHIVPVAEGGGGCGLDGYQTLCVPCHKRDTADLAARLVNKEESSEPSNAEQLMLFGGDE